MRKPPSPQEIEAAKTKAGGWTKATLSSWGVPWPPPRGWRKKLERRHRRKAHETHGSGMNGGGSLVDITLWIERESDSGKAVLVSSPGGLGEEVWLPHSQIQITGSWPGECSVAMPRWLAAEKDLL